VDQQMITGDAVAHYRKYCDRLPAIAFTVTTEHAAHVADEFKAAGYQAAVLTGQTPDKERAQMIRDLGNGKLQVLASCNVVSEGTDIPAVVAAILLRPTASYALAMQQIGRALRTMEGKEKAIILDHAGNTLRHGLPTDEVNWSLNGVDRGKVKLKKCPTCKAVVAYSVKKCPGCGKVFYVAAADQDADMVARDLPAVNAGELVEMSPERLRQLRRERFRAEAKCQSVAELAAIGVERGYKFPQQWAAKRFVELRV
jgi:superfamily II DNA or RNA helicase